MKQVTLFSHCGTKVIMLVLISLVERISREPQDFDSFSSSSIILQRYCVVSQWKKFATHCCIPFRASLLVVLFSSLMLS